MSILVTIHAVTCVVHVFYTIAQRSSQWFCFGVTLVVTGISAFLFNGSFGNIAVVWVVALSAGVLSGIVTECFRILSCTIRWERQRSSIKYEGQYVFPFSTAMPAMENFRTSLDNICKRVDGFADYA